MEPFHNDLVLPLPHAQRDLANEFVQHLPVRSLKVQKAQTHSGLRLNMRQRTTSFDREPCGEVKKDVNVSARREIRRTLQQQATQADVFRQSNGSRSPSPNLHRSRQN